MLRNIYCGCMSWRLCAIAVLWATSACIAETPQHSPIQVTTCDLENHPGLYDRKLVQVRGRIYFGKFDFKIESRCRPHGNAAVWLDIGGDAVSPSVYWGIADVLPKHRGTDVRVRGIPVPLVRDTLLDRFLNDVAATRFQKPTGDGCGSECLFYAVTATLEGRFFSGSKGGFGMEECCHLLVVERALNVSSRRTGVPFGGIFRCAEDRWQPTPDELNALSALPECSLRDDFSKCYRRIAKHWGDSIDDKPHLDYPGPWMSSDMTLVYKHGGNFIQQPGRATQMTPGTFFAREKCTVVSPPASSSEHVRCQFHQSAGLSQNVNTAKAIQERVDSGDESWRTSDMARVAWLAYQDATRGWGLPEDKSLKPAKCESSPPGPPTDGSKQQWGYCMFLSPGATAQVTVNLHRSDYLSNHRELNKMAWIAEGVEANTCTADSNAH